MRLASPSTSSGSASQVLILPQSAKRQPDGWRLPIVEITATRRDAIAKCIARDPKLARDFIDAEFGGDDQEVEWRPEMWLGINYEAFASIDDRTESRLRAILTPDQPEMLPARQRDEGRQASKKREGRKR